MVFGYAPGRNSRSATIVLRVISVDQVWFFEITLKTKNMQLFHGSPYRVTALKSPMQTGKIRPCEKNRKELLDVVFMTTNQEEARHYAGDGGYIYIVEAENPQQLCTMPVQRESRRKSVTIWVARPEKIIIHSVICPGGKMTKPFRERTLLCG